MLVGRLIEEAKRLGIGELYIGADVPGLYARFGAEVYEVIDDHSCVMRLELSP